MDIFQNPPSSPAADTHRPAVPPKPEKVISPTLESEKQTTGTQVNLLKRNSLNEKRPPPNRNGEKPPPLRIIRKPIPSPDNSQLEETTERQNKQEEPEIPQSPNPGKSVSEGNSPTKPALPPKPVGGGLLSPRKIVSVLSPSQVKPVSNNNKPKIFSAVNPIVRGFNTNTTTSKSAMISSSPQQSSFLNRIQNSNNHASNNNFCDSKNSTTAASVSRLEELDGFNELNITNNPSFNYHNSISQPTPNNNENKLLRPHPPRTSEFEHVSPNRNRSSLHLFNFSIFSSEKAPPPTTGAKNITQVKAKSASLGRNINAPAAFPTPNKKSTTLQRISLLPLDLSQPSVSQQRIIHKSNTVTDFSNPIRNFGRSISFAPESGLPPPPPPRQKKKPLSPIPQGQGLPPTWPPPLPPPPISPVAATTTVISSSSISTTTSPNPEPRPPPPLPPLPPHGLSKIHNLILANNSARSPSPPVLPIPHNQPVTYAKIDIEKKWALRKLRQEQDELLKYGNSDNENDLERKENEPVESDSDRYATIDETLSSSSISHQPGGDTTTTSNISNPSVIATASINHNQKDKDESSPSVEKNTNHSTIDNSYIVEEKVELIFKPVQGKENEESGIIMNSSRDNNNISFLSKYLPDPVCSINSKGAKENKAKAAAALNENNKQNSVTPHLAQNRLIASGTHEDANGNVEMNVTFDLGKTKVNDVLKVELPLKQQQQQQKAQSEGSTDEELSDNKSFLFCHKFGVDSNTNELKITTTTTNTKITTNGSSNASDENDSREVADVKLTLSECDNRNKNDEGLKLDSTPDVNVECSIVLKNESNSNVDEKQKSVENNDDSCDVNNSSFLFTNGKKMIHLDAENEKSTECCDNSGKMSPKNDAESLLNMVDEKIQSAVSLLSNLSGRSTPHGGNEESPTSSMNSRQEELLEIKSTENIPKESDKKDDAELVSEIILNSRFFTPRKSEGDIIPPPLVSPAFKESGIDDAEDLILSPDQKSSTLTHSNSFRRRSWNCDDASASPSESSSSGGSIHLRSRALPSVNKARNSKTWVWVDEGELSTGALGDAESSDALGRSSVEDMGSGKGSISKRRRFVNSIFGSFGKAGSTSGSSIRSGSGRKSKQDKTRSSFFPEPSEVDFHHIQKPMPLGGQQKMHHRQISEVTITPAKIILAPTSTSAAVLQNASSPFHSFDKPHVQFSPDIVSSSSTIHSPHPSLCQSFSLTDTESIKSDNRLSMTFSEEGSQIDIGDKADSESCSSSESGTSSTGSGSSSSIYNEIINELSPHEKKIFYVAREIMTSERTFVDVLNLLTVDFVQFVKKQESEKYHHAVISEVDLDNVLGGLSTLKQVNEELLKDLEERISHWKEKPKVSDIIVRKGPFLKHYSTYIRDFERIIRNVDTCCQKYPYFAMVVKDFEGSERCQKLGLKHFMLKPVQRMPQYRLLLEDYLKTLESNHEDYDDAVKAITIVRGVAEHADEAIRLQVSTEKLMHLQNRLPNAVIVKVNRQLLKEGELLKVCRKQLQPRFFALMNDCLLCMMYNPSAGAKDLKLRYELPLAGMRVSLTVTEDYQNEFSVISVTRSFNLVAKSAREREDWMKALNTAINNNIKARSCSTPDQEIGFKIGKEAPVWIQDSRVTMCQVCTGEFTLTFRRHHCRACGKVVCGPCSGSHAPLKYQDNKAARVCDECYQYLLEEFDQEHSRNLNQEIDTLRNRFKKVTPNMANRASKHKRPIPQRLEVQANNTGSRMSGYLNWKRERKSWKRHWFVLMDRVLYLYAASEDIVAIKSIPILGWNVFAEPTENAEGIDEQLVFKLTHCGQDPIVFQAENAALAEKWVTAMTEATVLT